MDYLKPITVQSLIFFKNKNEFPIFHFKSEEIKLLIEDLRKNKIGEYFLFGGIKDSFIADLTEIKADSDKIFSEETNQKFNSLYQKILESGDILSLTFTDLLLLNEDFLITNHLIGRFDTLKLIDNKKQELLDFIDDYIKHYSEGNLESEDNYYSKETTIEKVCEKLEGLHKDYGPKFIVNNQLVNDNRIRLFEILLFFQKEGLIKIIDCIFSKSLKNTLDVKIEFKKSPREIHDIFIYWDGWYGDLKVNEKEGIAFYKKNRYPFKSVNTRSFKLLCYFIKNHINEIPIDDLYYYLNPEDTNKETESTKRKKHIKDLLKDIQEKLKINKDEKPTIKFAINNDKILMIPNPPIQK